MMNELDIVWRDQASESHLYAGGFTQLISSPFVPCLAFVGPDGYRERLNETKWRSDIRSIGIRVVRITLEVYLRGCFSCYYNSLVLMRWCSKKCIVCLTLSYCQIRIERDIRSSSAGLFSINCFFWAFWKLKLIC